MENKDLLLGKTIISIKIAADKMALLFLFDDGKSLIARTDGECCSQTWIEHVELPTELPAKVMSAYDLQLDRGNEYMSYYGYKISTDKGDIVIDYRNLSNGYYGGSIVFGNEEDWIDGQYCFCGGVYDQNVSSEEWEDII